MAGCSHLPMWEQREAYMAQVAGWLARHDAHASSD
jgi:pimeloyl-ACP methyl ester carboxylesterase